MTGTGLQADDLPGYRRRIYVEPGQGSVTAMLEDDMHCMAVTLRHDGETVLAVEPVMERAPWTTCPGAPAKLVETFAGQRLVDVTARRDKKQNCTHLHDLAVLAAAHARDGQPLTYDILVSDPQEGQRILEIRRNGSTLWHWIERNGILAEPPEIAGQTLLSLREWISTLNGAPQEAARLLQWGGLVAHGRTLSAEQQSNASELPPNCYTLQPERAGDAVRHGEVCDFSTGLRMPLDRFRDKHSARPTSG